VRRVYDGLYDDDPRFGVDAIVDFLSRHPELNRTVDDV
jgi:hypothetical protein